MTFEKFAAIAAAHRPDAVVQAHGTFGGVADVAICFRRPDGNESRVYHYRGSYAAILNQLGIKVVTASGLSTAEEQLRLARASHGKPGLFSKGQPEDRSREIERLTALIAQYNSDEYIRDWE